jgi:hypothetical protein
MEVAFTRISLNVRLSYGRTKGYQPEEVISWRKIMKPIYLMMIDSLPPSILTLD